MQTRTHKTTARDPAKIEKFIASQAQASGDLRRNLNYLAYWLAYPVTLLECVLMACISVLHYWFWRVIYANGWRSGRARQRPDRMVKQKMDADNALAVMQTVERIGRQSGARMFWLSGTLLGLERLGRPLPHDTDMDAGICIDDPRYPDFIRALWLSGDVVEMAPQFISRKTRLQNPDLHVVPGGIIRYKLFVRNGHAPHEPPVKTDIFLHYRYCGGLMHGSRNTLWWNTSFSIVHKSYGDRQFSVPGDTHLHLAENYGDYRSEVRDFENSIDCPNAMNIFSWSSLAYLLVRQYVMLRLGRVDRARRVNMRIGATILKGLYPLRLRRPRAAYLGS